MASPTYINTLAKLKSANVKFTAGAKKNIFFFDIRNKSVLLHPKWLFRKYPFRKYKDLKYEIL